MAKGTYEYKCAGYNHVDMMVDLLTCLFEQESDFKVDEEAQKRGLTLILENRNIGDLLIAYDGSKVLGMMSLLYTISTAVGGRVAMVEDVVVLPEYRGQGIGTELMKFAIEFAKAQGVNRLTLLTDASNEKAQKFYQKFGFGHSAMLPMRHDMTF